MRCDEDANDTHETQEELNQDIAGSSTSTAGPPHQTSLINVTQSNEHTNGGDANGNGEKLTANYENVGDKTECSQIGANCNGSSVDGHLTELGTIATVDSNFEQFEVKVKERENETGEKVKSRKRTRKSGGRKSGKMGSAFGKTETVPTNEGSKFYTTVTGENLERSHSGESGCQGAGTLDPIVELDPSQLVQSSRRGNRENEGARGKNQQSQKPQNNGANEGTSVDIAEGKSDDDKDAKLAKNASKKPRLEIHNETTKTLQKDTADEDLTKEKNHEKITEDAAPTVIEKAYETLDLDLDDGANAEPVPLSPILEVSTENEVMLIPVIEPICKVHTAGSPALDRSQRQSQLPQQSPVQKLSPASDWHQCNNTSLSVKHSQEQQVIDDTCRTSPGDTQTYKKDSEITKASQQQEDLPLATLQNDTCNTVNGNGDQYGKFQHVDGEISLRKPETKTEIGESNNVKETTLKSNKKVVKIDESSEKSKKKSEKMETNNTKESPSVGKKDRSQRDKRKTADSITPASDGSKGIGEEEDTKSNNNEFDTFTDKPNEVQSSRSPDETTTTGLLDCTSPQSGEASNDPESNKEESEEYEILTGDNLEEGMDSKGKKKPLSFRSIGYSLRSAFKGKSKPKEGGLPNVEIGARLSQNTVSAIGKRLAYTAPGDETAVSEKRKESDEEQSETSEGKTTEDTNKVPVDIIVHRNQNGVTGTRTDKGDVQKEVTVIPDGAKVVPDGKTESPVAQKRPPVSASAWSRLAGIGAKKAALDGGSGGSTGDLSRTSSSGSLSSATSDDSIGK